MINQYNLSYVLKKIQENIGERELVFFGKHEEMAQYLRKNGYALKKVFTRVNSAIALEKNIFDAELLNQGSSRYYVFCAYRSTSNEAYLQKCGFKKSVDYVFYQPEKIIFENISLPYEDDYGNQVTGNLKGVSLVIEGFQNKIHIENGEVKGQLSIWCLGNGNVLECNKTRWNSDNRIALRGNENRVIIGNGNMTSVKLRCWGHSEINIEDNCSFGEWCEIITNIYTDIHIGADCMVAREVIIQAGDGHTIYDISTAKVTNQNRSSEDGVWSKIEIGEHVWLGRRTTVLSGGGKPVSEKAA